MEDLETLKYISFDSFVDSSFLHKLCQLKIDVDKLEEREREIRGFYLHPNSCSFIVDCTSFNKEYETKLGKTQFSTIKYLCDKRLHYNTPFFCASGFVLNFNTSTNFKNVDKNSIIEKYGKLIKDDIESGKAIDNPGLLNRFVIISYANIKTYEIMYWFGFPALSTLTFRHLDKPMLMKNQFSDVQLNDLLESHQTLSDENKSVFGVISSTNKLTCITLRKYIELENQASNDGDRFICFLDPSSDVNYPGWPLRNILFLLTFYCKGRRSIKVICLRLGVPFETSFVINLEVVENSLKEEKWVGWEKNKRDKFGPRYVNLTNELDPIRMADSSSDLNVKLMKWRLAPNLDLDAIKSLKCLLLGAGTLGCGVARTLIGWGVKHITFVDNGKVSFSNLSRQSLYNFSDCNILTGGKMKAEAAAAALKNINPNINSTGVVLDIPTPGHFSSTIENASKLHDLIEMHDVIFLLTDSRSSRWLPALISCVLQKLAITTALGFDNYVVLRHGLNKTGDPKLACFFCVDMAAPSYTMEDRTMDEQCTISRPGLANIASALAVELTMSVIQHHKKAEVGSSENSVLGTIPHSIRGSIHDYTQIGPSMPAFSKCVACSPMVVKAYTKSRTDFLKIVFESAKYLDEITGLIESREHPTAKSLQMMELKDDIDDDDDDKESFKSMEDFVQLCGAERSILFLQMLIFSEHYYFFKPCSKQSNSV